MPNKTKILSRMLECNLTIKSMSKKMGLTPYTLGRKLSGKSPMSIREARFIQKILCIPDADFSVYFFSP